MSVMRNKDQIYDPWSSRRMELWGQLTNGLYSFKFDVERIAPMAVRGIVFKPRASPVPGLTALPSFRDKGPTLHRAGPMCLNILCSHQLPLYFSFPTPYSSYCLLPQSFSLHMPPLHLKCSCLFQVTFLSITIQLKPCFLREASPKLPDKVKFPCFTFSCHHVSLLYTTCFCYNLELFT